MKNFITLNMVFIFLSFKFQIINSFYFLCYVLFLYHFLYLLLLYFFFIIKMDNKENEPKLLSCMIKGKIFVRNIDTHTKMLS